MNKKSLTIGFILGALTTISGISLAAKIAGSNGYLMGWDVVYKGRTICNSPFIWTSTREIECD
jgi:hypothetical protein